MVERSAPLPDAASLHEARFCKTEGLAKDNRWPPRGWPMLACITRESGTATQSERGSPNNSILRYDLSITPDGIYTIEITEGHMGRSGISLTPAIGMRFTARDEWAEESSSANVLDIHIRGQSLMIEKSAVLRAILAITYIISRIDRGLAPNIKRVLKIYRL